jgi:HSP20 family molecular chaperone IbpA
MKPYRTPESTTLGRSRKRAPEAVPKAVRECLALGDPTDCLLDAYDCVALRAYENFMVNGPRPGGELEDWLSAERQLLLGFQIDLHETDEHIYALASVPGATASRVSVGIESRWMVILVRQTLQQSDRVDCAGRTALRVGSEAQDRAQAERAHRVAALDEPRSADVKPPESSPRERFGIPPQVSDDRRAQSVCVLGLPATVDGSRSIAVLADGLLGIRMAKAHPGP